MSTGVVVLLGPPGAGKGTQAQRLASGLGVPHVSTGDLLRAHLRDETPVGLMAKGFMDRGLLVPDDVVCTMVQDRLAEDDAEAGCILDGFPRTIAQADALDGILRRLRRGEVRVVFFEVSDAVLVDRLAGRLTCPACGAVYHARLRPPREPGVCDACGARGLHVRADDRPEAVAARLEEYRRKTAPLLERYRGRGALVSVDGDRGVDEVGRDLELRLRRQ
jgi:adenylate kinase